MSAVRTRRVKIRAELILGIASVILLSCLATYLAVLSWTRRDFDTLVERNDVETAKSFAASLAEYYGAAGSWSGVEEKIAELRRDPASARADDDQRVHGRRHPGDSDLPLVLTDPLGAPLYVGLRPKEGDRTVKLPERLKTAQGERIIVNGSVVGYVFFKSMIFRSYNPQEEAFIASLARSIGVSILIGLALALVLGTALAARFAKPISSLDTAVGKIAAGDLTARVDVEGRNEIGSLAESFNRMADLLQGNEAARQNLLADIAHELRTPVSIIQANLEMIIDGVYAADEDRLKSLYEETRILTSLISNLRALSDLEAGSLPIRLERANLVALLNESCRKFKPLFLEKKVELVQTAAGEELRVLVDEDALRQVIRNLLGNALKYAPAGTTVWISAELIRRSGEGAAMVRTTIADEGEGVPDGDAERIFERFYRVDPSRNRESGGRGLGLAISKKIVDALNGRIGAHNREPQGLAVWFELPCEEAKA